MIPLAPIDGKITIHCVIGPTASGKSAYAIALAKKNNGEVISVDSRQVYRTLDIGTEKITREEMAGVPHHLIDIREPSDSYSAGDFVIDATSLIADMHHRGITPILAGGTHFYFDALINGIPEETPMDTALRERLELLSNEQILAEIALADPRRAGELDANNRRRLIRAREIIEQHGRVPERTREDRYNVVWHVPTPERATLREKIAHRLQDALTRGLIAEVRRTREALGDSRLNELGLEYKIVGEYLRGERSEASLLPALTAKLFQYARRQEAWIRKLTRIH